MQSPRNVRTDDLASQLRDCVGEIKNAEKGGFPLGQSCPLAPSRGERVAVHAACNRYATCAQTTSRVIFTIVLVKLRVRRKAAFLSAEREGYNGRGKIPALRAANDRLIPDRSSVQGLTIQHEILPPNAVLVNGDSVFYCDCSVVR